MYEWRLPNGVVIRGIGGGDKSTIQTTGRIPFAIVNCNDCGIRQNPGYYGEPCRHCAGKNFNVAL